MHRLFLLSLIALIGCSDVGSGPQIVINLQATPSAAAVGDTITFYVGAAASSLASVSINYGDGSMDARSATGLSSVQVTFKHVYTAAGSYRVDATATDAQSGSRSTGFTVAIQ